MHLPSWLPGAGFKRQAAAWRKHLVASYESGFRWVESRMVNIAKSMQIARTDIHQGRRQRTAIASGGQISQSFSNGCLCTRHPPPLLRSHVRRRLRHHELHHRHLLPLHDPPPRRPKNSPPRDRRSHLPLQTTHHNRRPRLPYINAILKECLRILSLTPSAPLTVSAKKTPTSTTACLKNQSSTQISGLSCIILTSTMTRILLTQRDIFNLISTSTLPKNVSTIPQPTLSGSAAALVLASF